MMSDEMIEMLVLLRINREFIEYMSTKYKEVGKEHALSKVCVKFGTTVVRGGEGESN